MMDVDAAARHIAERADAGVDRMGDAANDEEHHEEARRGQEQALASWIVEVPPVERPKRLGRPQRQMAEQHGEDDRRARGDYRGAPETLQPHASPSPFSKMMPGGRRCQDSKFPRARSCITWSTTSPTPGRLRRPFSCCTATPRAVRRGTR